MARDGGVSHFGQTEYTYTRSSLLSVTTTTVIVVKRRSNSKLPLKRNTFDRYVCMYGRNNVVHVR